MLRWFGHKVLLHECSFYILTRGLLLTAVFLLAGMALLLHSSAWVAARYAEYLLAMGAVLLGSSLLGPLLLEDVLRKCDKR